MEMLLPAVGVAYGATVIWLIVRLINRPEQWRKLATTAAFVVAVPTVVGVFCLIPSVSSGPPSRRSLCRMNLRLIGLALHDYHERFGSFPPAYIADINGRPMHSWRVLILPFIDGAPLYNKYRFDEPWDGPNNRKLAGTMPPVYTCPCDDHGGKCDAPTMTSYVAVVGDETAWPEDGAVSIRDIKDGATNTLLIVEVANSGIHWMEPRDLHVAQMAPTINAKSGQGISCRHTGGAHGLIADGSVRFIPENLTADALRAWLTAHAGDKNPDF
jgi:hypothetical protein